MIASLRCTIEPLLHWVAGTYPPLKSPLKMRSVYTYFPVSIPGGNILNCFLEVALTVCTGIELR